MGGGDKGNCGKRKGTRASDYRRTPSKVVGGKSRVKGKETNSGGEGEIGVSKKTSQKGNLWGRRRMTTERTFYPVQMCAHVIG